MTTEMFHHDGVLVRNRILYSPRAILGRVRTWGLRKGDRECSVAFRKDNAEHRLSRDRW